MTQLKWKSGPAARHSGPLLVSATRFTYRRVWHMPGVFWRGWLLRKAWGSIEGAVGVSISGDLLKKTTYTVSVWRSEADLFRWLASPDHAAVMRDYRARLESHASVSWQVERLALRETLEQARIKLAEKDAGH